MELRFEFTTGDYTSCLYILSLVSVLLLHSLQRYVKVQLIKILLIQVNFSSETAGGPEVYLIQFLSIYEKHSLRLCCFWVFMNSFFCRRVKMYLRLNSNLYTQENGNKKNMMYIFELNLSLKSRLKITPPVCTLFL